MADDVDVEHRIHRVEWAPYEVPYLPNGKTLEIDDAGFDLLDADWRTDGEPFKCSCGQSFASKAFAAGHLRESRSVQVRRLPLATLLDWVREDPALDSIPVDTDVQRALLELTEALDG